MHRSRACSLRRDPDVYTPLLARGVGLKSFVSNVVDEHWCTDLITPIRHLRVAVETDCVLLNIIGDLLRMTVPRAAGVRSRLFDIRRGTNSSDMRELAFAKL